MPIKSSPHFNNPQFAQAASNLSALFEPPSGADASAWANANAKKEEAGRLAQLFDYTRRPDFDQTQFDRMNIGVGNYAPTSSFYAQDQNDATTRRGQDVTASTSRANNADDNVRALEVGKLDNLADLYGPLNEGQMRPELPAGIAGRFGVESALPAVQGNEKPLSETEWNARQKDRLLAEGDINDQILVDTILGDQTPVQIVGENGVPAFSTPGAAVRTSAQPYDEPDDTKFDNYLAIGADGQEKQFLGYVGPGNQIFDSATQQPVPKVVRKESTGGGMSFETDGQGGIKLSTGNAAGNTTARTTDLQQQSADAGRVANEFTQLYRALRPDDVGIAGNVNELVTDYGAQMFPSLARPDVAATRTQIRTASLGAAKALVGDERLSDADRRKAQEIAVGDGLGESIAGAKAKAATLVVLMSYRQRFADSVRTGEKLPPLDGAMLGRMVDEGTVPADIAAEYSTAVLSRGTQSPGGPLPGVNVQEIGAAAGSSAGGESIPTIASPEEALRLPSGTQFRTPDGRVKVRP